MDTLGLEPKTYYMHAPTGAVDIGERWEKGYLEFLEERKAYMIKLNLTEEEINDDPDHEYNMFRWIDNELYDVIQDENGNWVEP